jgi:Secretion system C-terminal sorting domain
VLIFKIERFYFIFLWQTSKPYIMKNLHKLLLFTLLPITCPAQTINIPDPVFKARLLAGNVAAVNAEGTDFTTTVDTNGDGEIQVSEATAITGLALYNYNYQTSAPKIASLEGIAHFSNLRTLNVNVNNLTTLDLTALSQLNILKADSNQLTALNVAGLSNLKTLHCSVNELSAIDTTGLTALEFLWCSDNNLTSLNAMPLTSIQKLYINGNQIATLDLTYCPALQYLWASENNLTSVNIINLSSLIEVYLDSNELSDLDTSGLSGVQYLDVSSNYFTNINTLPLQSVLQLAVSNNQINTLEVNNMPQIISLLISNNLFSGYLDYSQVPLIQLACDNNTGVTGINVQNGAISLTDPDMLFYAFSFSGLPNLTSVCVDNEFYERRSVAYSGYNSGGQALVYTGPGCNVEVAAAAGAFKENSIMIAPNPFTDHISVTADYIPDSAAVYDLTGRLVATPVVSYSDGSAQLNLNTIAQSGMYLLTLNFGDKLVTHKIIKE